MLSTDLYSMESVIKTVSSTDMSGCSLLAINILATRLFVHSNTDVIDHIYVFGIQEVVRKLVRE